MRRWRFLFAGGVLLLAGAGFMALQGGEPEGPEVTTVRTRRQTLSQSVRATGHVEPTQKVRVSASITGDLTLLSVREGQRVKRGMLLGEINPGTSNAQLLQKMAQLRSVQAQVEVEEARLAQAQAHETQTARLQAQSFTSEAELIKAQADTRMARAQLEAAQQRVKQSEGELAELQSRLVRTRLVAPIDGTVISLEKKQGERVMGSEFAEDVLLTLAPLDVMEVEVEVGEQDVVSLDVGDAATVTLSALGNQEIPARVTEIGTSAVVLNRGQPGELTRFKVRLTLERIPPGLRPGMTGRVNIVATTREGVLAVPFEAVTARFPHELQPGHQQESGAPAPTRQQAVQLVFVPEDGKVVARPVQTGLASDTHLEVLGGLREGEEVITGPYHAVAKELRPGTPVRARPQDAPAPTAAQGAP